MGLFTGRERASLQSKTASQLALQANSNNQAMQMLNRAKPPIGTSGATISSFNAEAGSALTEKGPVFALSNSFTSTAPAQTQTNSVIPVRNC